MGTRLGRGPKAFVALAGQPLIARTVAAFQGVVDEVVVAVSAELMGEARALLSPETTLCEGGATRQQTVYRLLQATDADIVLIHDAARPFLPPDIIRTTVEAVERCGAASVVKLVADTLIDKNTGMIIDRDKLRAVQTPQGFRRDLILGAHKQALADSVTATDDAGLVRWMGHPVALVEGSSWLLKITTPADFEMAEALAAVWDVRETKR